MPRPSSKQLAASMRPNHAVLNEVTEVNGMGHGGRHAPSQGFDEGKAGGDSFALVVSKGLTLHRTLSSRKFTPDAGETESPSGDADEAALAQHRVRPEPRRWLKLER